MLETALVIGAVAVIGAANFVGGRAAALPAIGLILAGAFRFLPALNQVLFLVNQVQYNGPAIDLVEDELAAFNTVGGVDGVEAPLEPMFDKQLRLSKVWFSYPTRPDPALRGISLDIQRGHCLGIVGSTGSGKSTLLDVILGFLRPDSGSITLDGRPLADCVQAWQRHIGYVPQDVYLVDDSLRANVALGWRGDEVDEDAVADAIRLAQLEGVIASLPEGLETMVGERGVRFSGGQRQRLGLARALYVRPSVLVLDEATSNLDTATEQTIVETLGSLRDSLTTILVTHRLGALRLCDDVICLEHGKVAACGSYAEVVSAMATAGQPGWDQLLATSQP
jgi:ABC-type multidrug transport system fused ATPase/permease subunit